MKKILIVNKSFEIGGIQSSMINMANELSNYYNVDLLLYNPEGPLKSRLNEKINVLSPSWRLQALGMSLKESLRNSDLRIKLFRILISIWTKLFSNRLPINIVIKHQRCIGPYDIAISYHHERSKKSVQSGFCRIVDKCVNSSVKVAWLHYDCETIDMDFEYNKSFYDKMDKIICVSKSQMNNFLKLYPISKNKIDFCYNFINYESIINKSLEKQKVLYPPNNLIFFSACRLTKEKGLLRAIKVLSSIFKKNKDLIWYIAGDGPEKKNIEKCINELNLEKYIILLGNQENPYPYMKNADLIINVSYHEAAPMVFLEAQVLNLPVFATKTSSALELLSNGINAFVCDNSEVGIYNTFLNLVVNRNKIFKAKNNFEDYSPSNYKSLTKINSFLTLKQEGLNNEC